jgi:GTP cyclohydrolase I
MNLIDTVGRPAERRPAVDVVSVEQLYRQLLVALGEDPDRDGLRDTPRRAAAWWSEFLGYDVGRLDTVFDHDLGGEQYVAIRDITDWSLCEHHLLPFRVRVGIAYVPDGRVLGLSKLARIVSAHARSLQLQERLTAQIAHAVAEATGSPDVGVWVDGEHLCMSIRGVRAETARTTTGCLLGRLRNDHALADRLRVTAHPASENHP